MLRAKTIILFLLAISIAVIPTMTSRASDEVPWTVPSMLQAIQPMQNDLGDRIPLMVWDNPLPKNDQLVTMKESGVLKGWLEEFGKRGVIPFVHFQSNWTPQSVMAIAKTIKDAGLPVRVLLVPAVPKTGMGPLSYYAYESKGIWMKYGWALSDEIIDWPCFPIFDGEYGGNRLVELYLKPLKEAGITIEGVVFDDEGFPYPWNGARTSQADPRCGRKAYLEDADDLFKEDIFKEDGSVDFERFKAWMWEFRPWMQGETGRSIKSHIPTAFVGNYGDDVSSSRADFGMDASMPILYAGNRGLWREYEKEAEVPKVPTHEEADRFFFYKFLSHLSEINRDKIEGKLSIPYMSRRVAHPHEMYAPYDKEFRLAPYRNFIRHAWLRGMDSAVLYTVKPAYNPTNIVFDTLEATRSTLDDMLSYGDLFNKGVPMNFEVHDVRNGQPVWSGVKYENKCLIFTNGFSGGPETISVPISPTKSLTLSAPVTGKLQVVDCGESAPGGGDAQPGDFVYGHPMDPGLAVAKPYGSGDSSSGDDAQPGDTAYGKPIGPSVVVGVPFGSGDSSSGDDAQPGKEYYGQPNIVVEAKPFGSDDSSTGEGSQPGKEYYGQPNILVEAKPYEPSDSSPGGVAPRSDSSDDSSPGGIEPRTGSTYDSSPGGVSPRPGSDAWKADDTEKSEPSESDSETPPDSSDDSETPSFNIPGFISYTEYMEAGPSGPDDFVSMADYDSRPAEGADKLKTEVPLEGDGMEMSGATTLCSLGAFNAGASPLAIMVILMASAALLRRKE